MLKSEATNSVASYVAMSSETPIEMSAGVLAS